MILPKTTEDKLDGLASAARSGQLGQDVSNFVLITIRLIRNMPEGAMTAADIRHHLKTLTYLVELHVYRER